MEPGGLHPEYTVNGVHPWARPKTLKRILPCAKSTGCSIPTSFAVGINSTYNFHIMIFMKIESHNEFYQNAAGFTMLLLIKIDDINSRQNYVNNYNNQRLITKYVVVLSSGDFFIGFKTHIEQVQTV
jgi:hypothetical protein